MSTDSKYSYWRNRPLHKLPIHDYSAGDHLSALKAFRHNLEEFNKQHDIPLYQVEHLVERDLDPEDLKAFRAWQSSSQESDQYWQPIDPDMPLFSTTEPGFMGLPGSEVFHMHLKGDSSIVNPNHVRMYFDGSIADKMGYDMPFLLSGCILCQDGQECRVITPEGDYHTAYINNYQDLTGATLWYIQAEMGVCHEC